MMSNEQIKEISMLEDGWDGVGSYGPSSETIANVYKILELMPAQLEEPDSAPTANGTVYLGWERDNHTYLDIEVGKTKVAAILVLNHVPQFSNVEAEDLNEVVKFMEALCS